MKDNLATKFLKFSYGSWVGLLLGLLTTMITTRILPPETFGKVSMFDLFLQVGLIFTVFGTDQSFVRFFYEEESSKRGALLFNSLRVPVLTTIIMIIVVLSFYAPITTYLIGEENFSLSIILVTGIVAQLFFRYGQLAIRMQQKGNLYSLLQIFQKVFNFTFILMFYYLIGSTYEVLIYSKVITLILLAAISIFFSKQLWSLKNLLVKNVKHSQSEIVRFGAPFVLTIFITWLFESFDKIALRYWSDFEELGMYAAAMRLVMLVMVLRVTFSTFWTPIAYEKFEHNPKDKSFFRYIATIVSFTMFVVGIISIAGKDIIVILLGSEYKEAASIMPFLVFMPILYTISETTVVGINFYKKTKWHIVIAIISCVFNIFGNWLLVPEYGALGASISTAFSFVIFFILRTYISQRYYNVKYPLGRIYSMVLVLSAYSIYSILSESFWINLVFGFLIMLFLVILFYRDIVYVIKNRKMLFN